MKGVLFEAPQELRFGSVDDPVIQEPTDVVVEVERTAVCGSDLHVYHGRETGIDAGTVMGHEFVGRIVESGGAVSLRKGDRVFSPFFSSCGGCFYCRSRLSCRCEKGQLFGWVEDGVGLQGAQAEYVRVPLADTTLYRLPSGMSPESGLLLCDILPTGYYCADMAVMALTQRLGETASREAAYCVIGCGPVGLMAVASLKMLGCSKIHVYDLVHDRLQLAREFGAARGYTNSGELLAGVREATAGRGVDAVLEVVGNPAAQRTAYELVRAGGVISSVGVHTAPSFSFAPVDLYNKNLVYLTGRCPVANYVAPLMDALRGGEWGLERVITHRMKLSEGAAAYDLFDRRQEGCIKVVLMARNT